MSGAAPNLRRSLPGFVTAIASALVGGGLFAVVGLPMPWLLGSIVGTAIATMGGLPVRVPSVLRDLVLVILGLMIGATLDPAVLGHLAQWPVSLIGVILYVAVATTGQYQFLRRVGGYDAPTAYFSAAPGGFMAMTVIGGSFGGQERTIALMHAVRVVLVVFIIVMGYHLIVGSSGANTAEYVALGSISPYDLATLAGLGALGALAARVLRLPAHTLLGPLLVMASLRLTGVIDIAVPSAPIVVAEIVLGSSIGAQFAGATLAELRRGFLLSLISTLFMLALTGVFAVAVHALSGLPIDALLLAFSPGGMSGISLIALALNIEPAFVTVHNMTRVLVILVAGPALFGARVKADASE
ncbi:AbrB family transcriptional regulator [Salinisphaera sp. T31B1]|uniref:AbrB family transcriptional regulator n=1 Tax=Salinisphaera sp. T31B1 TaxID=727963 RepID=UPI00333F4E84